MFQMCNHLFLPVLREVRESHQSAHGRETVPVWHLFPALLHQVEPDRAQEEARRRRSLPEEGAQMSLLQQAACQQENSGQTCQEVSHCSISTSGLMSLYIPIHFNVCINVAV